MTPEQGPRVSAAPTVRRAEQQQRDWRGRGRAIVVGLAPDVPRALEHPAMVAGTGFEVAGVVTVAEDDASVGDHSDALHSLLLEHRASVVMVAGPIGPQTMRAVADLSLLHGCRLLSVMPTEIVTGQEPVIVWEGESPLVQLATHRRSPVQEAFKRFGDALGAAVGVTLLAPVMLLVAIAIRLESPGPVLFRHWRVGRNGRCFHCLKFRTMRADAEDVLRADEDLQRLYRENHYKLPDDLDPRVTKFGRFLRKTSLDEVPQLFNVLVGEMSLVGPRPVIAEELEHYRGSERLLLSVRPGMTGEWAVNGRHHVGYPARAELELRYVREWSLSRDIGILLGTVSAVLDPGSDVPEQDAPA